MNKIELLFNIIKGCKAKISFVIFFSCLKTFCISQPVAFNGKVEYVGESLLPSGVYKEFVKTVTYFNETMQGDYQINKGLDVAAMVETQLANFIKQCQKNNIPLDSFEIIKQKEKFQAAVENRAKTFENTIRMRFTSYDDTISASQVMIGTESYCITDTFTKTNWTLLEDTMTIEGLFCQKAEGAFLGKSFEVWFTLSLNFSAGPTVMHGLPGIIVMATSEDKKRRYKMTKIEYPLSKNIQLANCENEKKISWKEYKELMAKHKVERQKKLEELMKTGTRQ
jgi:GLPGLI family protein